MPRTTFYTVTVDGAYAIEGEIATQTLEQARRIRASVEGAYPYGSITRVTVDLPIRALAVALFNRVGYVDSSEHIVLGSERTREAP